MLINTLGMGIAMACCMTAYLLIAYNIEFDEYFNDDQVQNVVKIVHHFETSNGNPDKELVIPIGWLLRLRTKSQALKISHGFVMKVAP